MFIASKVLALFAQPLHWVIAMLALSVLLPQTRRQLARRMTLSAMLLLLALGWQPLPDVMVRQLESTYSEFAPDANLTGYAGVVVLGGALDAGYLAQDHQQPLLGASAERMTAAFALAQRHPGLRIVFTGGEGELFGTGPSEADRAAREGVVVAVSRIVASEWPQASVHVRSRHRGARRWPMRLRSSRRALLGGSPVFGSYSTGLFLPTSDIDLVVLHSGVSAVAGLRRIAEVRSL